MNRLIQLKQRTSVFLVAIGLACFGLSPAAPAVSPPPDGGYPNFTTAEGQNALLHLTTGAGNTAVGALSLSSDTAGNYNVGVGGGALALNNADSNTAIGTVALLLNTTGTRNTATGTDTLVLNSTGDDNTAVGAFALEDNTANGNTAVGSSALIANTTGSFNNAVGRVAMGSNTTGSNNTAIGDSTLYFNTIGAFNTASGETALFHNTTGIQNTANGDGALYNNTTGSNNAALGFGAGSNLTTGDNNIDIGYQVGGVAGESNTIRIGNTNITTTIIRGISGSMIASGATVLVDTNGMLGTVVSSRRFKDAIKPMDQASEVLFALKPVTFRYKKEIDPQGISQFGLVAEDVEKVNPDLVLRDKEGKTYSVRYDQVNAMLLNEFLKEHNAFVEEQRKVQEQGGTIARLERQIEALTAGLQKVSAQLELSKPAPQTVGNSQ